MNLPVATFYSDVPTNVGDYFEFFRDFVKNTPPPTDGSRIYAVATIEYSLGLYGEQLMETTTYTTEAATVDYDDLEAVFVYKIRNPILRHMHRYINSEVCNITFFWE